VCGKKKNFCRTYFTTVEEKKPSWKKELQKIPSVGIIS
jgi:hypothetical protein